MLIYMKSIKRTYNDEVVSVRLHVSSPKVPNEFLLNLVSDVYTKNCQENVILVGIGPV
jgi:hypothetical protein